MNSISQIQLVSNKIMLEKKENRMPQHHTKHQQVGWVANENIRLVYGRNYIFANLFTTKAIVIPTSPPYHHPHHIETHVPTITNWLHWKIFYQFTRFFLFNRSQHAFLTDGNLLGIVRFKIPQIIIYPDVKLQSKWHDILGSSKLHVHDVNLSSKRYFSDCDFTGSFTICEQSL